MRTATLKIRWLSILKHQYVVDLDGAEVYRADVCNTRKNVVKLWRALEEWEEENKVQIVNLDEMMGKAEQLVLAARVFVTEKQSKMYFSGYTQLRLDLKECES